MGKVSGFVEDVKLHTKHQAKGMRVVVKLLTVSMIVLERYVYVVKKEHQLMTLDNVKFAGRINE